MATETAIQADGLDEQESAARRASIDAEAKTQIARAAVELRDQWVIRLSDAGYRRERVAQVMLISKSRVMQILAAKG